jgi:hypothetical protein
MKTHIYVALVFALCTGCTRQATDVAGQWYFVSGGWLTLKQTGHNVEGSGEWGDNPLRPIAVTGQVEGSQMTISVVQTPGNPGTLRYDVAMSPKGNKRFLKCRESMALSLIPMGINYWEYDILKKEMTEQRKQSESSQQGGGTARR